MPLTVPRAPDDAAEAERRRHQPVRHTGTVGPRGAVDALIIAVIVIRAPIGLSGSLVVIAVTGTLPLLVASPVGLRRLHFA